MRRNTRASANRANNTLKRSGNSDEHKKALSPCIQIDVEERSEDVQHLNGGSISYKNDIELPVKLSSFESFSEIFEPLIRRINQYFANDKNFIVPNTENDNHEDLNSSPNFDSRKALHFTGALLQDALRFYFKDSTLFFELNHKSAKPTSNKDVLNSLWNRSKKKAGSTHDNLSLEFLLTFQEEFNPFLNPEEEEVVVGLGKLVKEYETLLNNYKGEHRANYFSKLQNRGEIHEPEKPKKGGKKKDKVDISQFDEENEGILSKARMLLNEIKIDLKTKFDRDNIAPSYRSSKLSLAFGGDIQIHESKFERKVHSDELRLREVLVSEYNTPTNEGFQKALELYVTGKSKSLKISLYTAMLLSLIYTRLSQRLKDLNLATLENCINLSRLIPFSTTPALKILRYRFFMAKALDIMMSVEVQNCLPRSAYFHAIQEFDFETNRINETSSKLCASFLALYNSEAIQITTDISSKLSLYHQQLSLLNKIFCLLAPRSDEADKENISPCKINSKKSPISGQMEKLIEDAASLPNMNDFAEYEYLLSLHMKKLTGGLVIQKSSNEMEWISPKFGRSYEPNDKLNDTPGQKELFTITKNLHSIHEERPLENLFNRSNNTSIDNHQSFNNSEIIDQDWTLNDISADNNRFAEEVEEEKMMFTSDSVFVKDNAMEIESLGIQEEFQIRDADLQPRKGNVIEEGETSHRSLVTEKTLDNESTKQIFDQVEKSNDEEIGGVKDKRYLKIEKEIATALNGLAKNSTLAETEKKLKELKSTVSVSIFKKKKGQIEAQIKKTKDWLHLYNQQVLSEKKSICQVQKLVSQISESELHVPEMEQLLHLQKAFMLWKLKVESALKKVKRGMKPSSKKRKDASENLHVKDLAELIREAKDLHIPQGFEDAGFQEIQTKWAEIESLKSSFESGGNDLNSLRKIKNKLTSLLILYPELECSLNEKIEINELMVALLEETVSLDNILAFKKTIKDDTTNLDPMLYSQTIRKIEEAQRYQEVVQNFISSQKVYQLGTLRDIIKILSEIDSYKLDIPGTDILKNILASFSWLLRVHQVIKRILSEFNGPQNGLDFSLSEEKFEANKLIEFCIVNLDIIFSNLSLTEEHKSELKKVFREGESLMIMDERILSLLGKLRTEIWRIEISNFSQDNKISEDFERYMHVPVELVAELGSTATSELQAEAQKIKDWNALYNEIFSSDIEDFLRKRVETNLEDCDLRNSLMSLRWKFQKLSTEYDLYFVKYPDFSNKVAPIQKFLGWIDWLFQAKACIDGLRAKDGSRLEILQKLYTDALELEIPKFWTTRKKIEELFTLADSALAEYKQKFQYANSYERWTQSKGSLRKESIHKIVEKNRSKPLFSEAKTLREILSEKLHYIDCEAEIADLDKKIESYFGWKAKMEYYSTNDGQRILRAAMDSQMVVKDTDRIEIQLGQLHSEYSSLSLRDEQDEKLLLGLECQLRAYKLLRNISRNPTFDEWKKLLKYSEENPNIDPTNDKQLMHLLKTEIEELKFQQGIVKTLQNSMLHCSVTDLTLDDLYKILKNFEKGSIKAEEDQKFMFELVQKIEKLVNRGRELCSSNRKEPIIEFTKVLEQMKHLPIVLADEDKELQEVVGRTNYIVNIIRKHPVMELQEAEKILKEYKLCPAIVFEAEKLQENYDRSKQTYQALKAQLNDILRQKNQLEYDQLTQLSEKLENINYNFENNLTLMRSEVFSMKIELLQKLSKSFDVGASSRKSSSKKPAPSFIICSEMIGLLAREGQELSETLRIQKKSSGRLDQALLLVADLLEKVEEKTQEIASEGSLDTLERIPRIMLGFINFSQTIIERKAALTTEISQNQGRQSLSKQITIEEETPATASDFFYEANQTQFLDQKGKFKANNCESQTNDVNLTKASKSKEKEIMLQDKKESVQKQPASAEPNSHLKQETLKLEEEKQLTRTSENFEKKKPNLFDSQGALEIQPQKTKNTTKPSPVSKEVKPLNKIEPNNTGNSMSVMTVRDMLQSSKNLSLDLIESLKIAQRIVKGFPMIQNPIKLKKFVNSFKEVLKYPKICNSLVKKSFSTKYILELIAKSCDVLLQLENQIGNTSKEEDKENKKSAKPADENDNYLIAKKKIKNELNSRVVNIADRSSNLPTEMQQIDTTRDPRLKRLLKESETALFKDAASIAADSKRSGISAKSKFGTLLSTNQSPSLSSFLQNKSSAPQGIASEELEIEQENFSDGSDKEDLAGKNKELRLAAPTKFDFEELPHENMAPIETEPTQDDSNIYFGLRNNEKPPSVSKPKKIPILNDPEDPEGSIQASPIKVSDHATMPNKDSILKIFEGTLKGVDNELIPSMGFYTCDSLQKTRCLPKLPSDNDNALKIQARMSFLKFEPYLNQFLSTFNENKNYIISGWVESENIVCENICSSMALNYLAENKIGIIKYYECTKLYLLHEKQFRPEWVRWLKFKKKKLNQNSCPSLYFLLIFQPNKFPFDLSILKFLEPEVVESYRLKKKKLKKKSKQCANKKQYLSTPQDFEVSYLDDSLEILTPQIDEDDQDSVIEDLKQIPYERSVQLNLTHPLREKNDLDFIENLADPTCRRISKGRDDKIVDSMLLHRKDQINLSKKLRHQSNAGDNISQSFEEKRDNQFQGCNSCSQIGMLSFHDTEEQNMSIVAYANQDKLAKIHKSLREKRVENDMKGADRHSSDYNCSCQACRLVNSQRDFDQNSSDDLVEELRLEKHSFSPSQFNSRIQKGRIEMSERLRNHKLGEDDDAWLTEPHLKYYNQQIDAAAKNQVYSPTESSDGSFDASFGQDEPVQGEYQNEIMEEEEPDQIGEIYNQRNNNQIRELDAHKLYYTYLPHKKQAHTQNRDEYLMRNTRRRKNSNESANNCSCRNCSNSIPKQIIYVVSEPGSQCPVENCLNCQQTSFIHLNPSLTRQIIQKDRVVKQMAETWGTSNINLPSQFTSDLRLASSNQHMLNLPVVCNQDCYSSQDPDCENLLKELPIDSNLQMDEMEIERNKLSQVEKPKNYDPSVNPLYQSYLNKKKFERTSSQEQPTFQLQPKKKKFQISKSKDKLPSQENALFIEDYIDGVESDEFVMQDDYFKQNGKATQRGQLKGYNDNRQQHYFW